MSQSFKIGGVVGGPLDDSVINQLDQRKKIVSKRTSRTSEDIIYLNSNTGWVRVTSAVDIPDEGGSTNARHYTLFNGIAGATQGFNLDSEKSSYSQSTDYGFVPIPGITQFSVRSKGTFGTLRDISFAFTVHSPEQFSILERLYLRPGYTLLIEWGHSIILDDQGTISTNVKYFNKEKFLTPMKGDDIQSDINDLKKRNYNNYDALYGFIKNFTWTYNGYSYECLVEVVSKGEIINSIRSTFAPSNPSPDGEKAKDLNTKKFSSDLTTALTTIKNAPFEKLYIKGNTEPESPELSPEDAAIKALNEANLSTYANALTDFKLIVGSLGGASSTRTSKWLKYISLKNFLELVNTGSLLTDEDGDNLVQFYVGTDKATQFTTFSNHFGLDPAICVLPKSANAQGLVIPFSRQGSGVDYESLLNIFVSIDYIQSKIDELKNAEDTLDDTIYNLVQGILTGINKNLGNINDLSLNYEEEDNLYYPVDRNVIPSSNDFDRGANNKPKSYIDLVGLNSEIENLNITSKISEKLTSMIAIAAQASPNPSAASNTLNIQNWNRGLIDRHLSVKNIGLSKKPVKDTEPIVTAEIETEIKQHIENISEAGNNYYIGYDKDKFEGYAERHTQLMGEYLKVETEARNLNNPGLIPFELSFTMKGISGMKIGQAFKVNEFFLPDSYKGRVAFIITGLDHSVANGRWTTSVKTQITVI